MYVTADRLSVTVDYALTESADVAVKDQFYVQLEVAVMEKNTDGDTR